MAGFAGIISSGIQVKMGFAGGTAFIETGDFAVFNFDFFALVFDELVAGIAGVAFLFEVAVGAVRRAGLAGSLGLV